MGIRVYKPTSPGRRGMSVLTFDDLTKTRPERSLIEPLPSKSGRNNRGKITVRQRGGGHKRLYRIIDFKRDKFDVPARVVSIEYDPEPLGPHCLAGLCQTAPSATSWRPSA